MTFDPGHPIGPPRAGTGIPFSGRLLFGAVVLTLGVLWTLENLGLLDADAVLRWWPALLLVYGIARVFGLWCSRGVVSGTLFALAGGWMLLREIGVVDVSIFRLWPLFLVFLGASIVWRATQGSRETGTIERASFPRPFAFMGGVTRNIESQDLVAIEATALMGGVELDLHGARARGREVVLEAFACMGGIDLFVPEDWRVVLEATPIMGGVEDQSRVSPEGATTTLIVRGLVLMGGIDIKNSRRSRGPREERSTHAAGGGGAQRRDAGRDDPDAPPARPGTSRRD